MEGRSLMFPKLKTKENAIIFLEKASEYFANRPTHGEDKAYWANVMNSDRCKEIIEMLKDND